jgi:hypothetical protein
LQIIEWLHVALLAGSYGRIELGTLVTRQRIQRRRINWVSSISTGLVQRLLPRLICRLGTIEL